MPTIKRTCSNRIISRTRQAGDRPSIALLLPGAEDCEVYRAAAQLQSRLAAEAEAIIVYNQQADAIRLVEGPEVSPAQYSSSFGKIPGACRACRPGTGRIGQPGHRDCFTSKTAGRGSPPRGGDGNDV